MGRKRIYASDADRVAAHRLRQSVLRNRDSVTLPNAPLGTAGDEAYTMPAVIAAARAALGRIDLDPASCAQAQEVVRAGVWCGLDHPDPARRDGLVLQWAGRVWCNPPFSAPLPWVDTLAAAYQRGDVPATVMLLRGDVSAAYAQRLRPLASASCWPSPRLQFWPHRVDAQGRRSSPNFPVMVPRPLAWTLHRRVQAIWGYAVG